MNNVFYRLADFTLKRFCRFILKITIAQYVDVDELLLDSLLVSTCDRKASLHDIRLKHDVINDQFFYSKMISIESASISELEVHIQQSCIDAMNKMLISNDDKSVFTCRINGLDVVLKMNVLPTGYYHDDDLDIVERMTVVTTEDASIDTVIDAINEINGDNNNDDDINYIRNIISIKAWIQALKQRLPVTVAFSIHCASIKIITQTSSPKKKIGTCCSYLNEKDVINQLILIVVILLLWLPIFYYN